LLKEVVMDKQAMDETRDQIADLISGFENEYNSEVIRRVIQDAMEIIDNALTAQEGEDIDWDERNSRDLEWATSIAFMPEYDKAQITKRKIEEMDKEINLGRYSLEVKEAMFDWLNQQEDK
jgi:predicted ArsR family transcriptional regulator